MLIEISIYSTTYKEKEKEKERAAIMILRGGSSYQQHPKRIEQGTNAMKLLKRSLAHAPAQETPVNAHTSVSLFVFNHVKDFLEHLWQSHPI